MAKAYDNYDDDDHEQGEEDDDIGALGSILSWDEDEDGAVGGTSNSGGESSGLPDLVSFNLKDGSLNALQQLQAAGDAPNLNLPQPTHINFAQQKITGLPDSGGAAMPRHKQEEQKPRSRTPQPLAAAPSPQHGVAVTQQQLQQQLQQQHQIQQYQMQQQQQQQQMQQQQQQQMQQQTNQGQASQAAPTLLQQPSAAQQQAQVAQHQAQAAQQAAAQQGAFQLFQQGALLAQSQNSKQQSLVPSIMMPNVSQQGQDVQNQAQQFAFAADPASFLRQLQVAQLQQQFNAVQQGRSLAPQVVVPSNQAAQAMPQQMHFQGQQVAAVAPAPPAAPQAPAPKRAKGSATKKPPSSSGATQSSSLASMKAPIVSASDTDGESRIATSMPKASKKSSSSLADSYSFMDNQASEIDMSHLSPAEKAKANRDRNREHARNTRLRKKAYLEKLKSTVDELCRERDTLVSERAGAANILVEMHNTRTEVLMSFFALRSGNEKRRELWSSILDESCFACVMPVTPYRSFPASEVQVSKCQRTILGIDGMMSDTASLHVLLNSLVDRSRFPNSTIVFRYALVTEEAVVAGNQMMARWVMSTLNATQCGARMEVAKQGMLCCKFNSAHKIIGLELMFDVMAFMLQLKQAAGSDTFSVIPNTVQTCQRTFDKPMIMTLAEEPYTIVQVNKLWENMTGYKAEEVVGKASCRLLEGEETEASAVDGLMNEVRFKRPASAMIVRYKKSREKFRDFFLAYPLSTDSRITHYLYLSSHFDSGQSLAAPSQQTNQGVARAPNAVASAGGAAQLPPPQVPTQAEQVYYGISNLPGSAGTPAQQVTPGAQSMFHLPAVMSNPLVGTQQPQTAVLASAVGPSGGPPTFQVGGLKRSLAGSDNARQPSKHSKPASTGAVSTGSST